MEQIKQQIGESKTFDTEQYYSPNANISIDDVIQYLQDCKSNGALYVNFNGSGDRDGDVYEVEIKPFIFRDETEEEITSRLKHEKEMGEWRKNNPMVREYGSLISALVESNKTNPICKDGRLVFYPKNQEL